MASDHDRDIAEAGRAILRPLGCVQRGRSRTWLDDRGWWVGMIEFQPSGFSKGSYLNVGACFLWSEKEYLSFDDLWGERPWHDAIEGESFAPMAMALATQGRDALLELRQRHASPAATARWLSMNGHEGWGNFHAAVAHGLAGNVREALTRFSAFSRSDGFPEDLYRVCESLAGIVREHAAFVTTVRETIRRTRALMKLPQIDQLL